MLKLGFVAQLFLCIKDTDGIGVAATLKALAEFWVLPPSSAVHDSDCSLTERPNPSARSWPFWRSFGADTVPADESSDDVRSSFQRPTPPHLATSGTEMPT